MNDLNFFEPYLGKKKENRNVNLYIYGALFMVSFIIILSFAFNMFKLRRLDKNIQEYNNKLNEKSIQVKLKEAEETNKKIGLLDKYNVSLNNIYSKARKRNNVSYDLLNKINSTVPSEVVFKSLSIESNTILIDGTSSNRESVAELKRNLSELYEMEYVYVNSINNKDAVLGEYSFNIKCVLKEDY